MKLKFNILSIATASMLAASLSSCNDWLKVDMEDQVLESALFSDYKGFRTALNGIYVSMIPQYCSTFSTTNLDVMAQCWNVSQVNNHNQMNWALFRYGEAAIEQGNSAIWNGFYNLIANVNVIIEHTVDNRSALTADQYGMMRGEALALRAMFHFDLLRLYGPIFSISDQLECMPYQATSKREILPFLKACDVLDLVIKDLDEAAGLLKDVDPIITEGAKLESIVNDGVSFYDNSFRQLRLNYYAVQALRARAYLWKGDKTKAYDIAVNEIINPNVTDDLTVFPWVTRAAATSADKPDLVFSTEVMFSIYNTQREREVHTPWFAGTNEKSKRLTFPGEDLESSKVGVMYESGDYRLAQWLVVDPTATEKNQYEQSGGTAPNSLAFMKFAPLDNAVASSTDYFRYMIPLIRLSEIYLIAAECAPNQADGLEYLNELRLHRNLPDYPAELDLQEGIFKEMFRETLGEGQMYFYYKRLASPTMISGTSNEGNSVDMTLENYVMPTPLDELAQRETNGASTPSTPDNDSDK